MIDIQRREIVAGDLELSYLEAGEGPPVLFLHGWPTNAHLWRNVLPVVGRHRRAIALDLPGFGASSKPTERRYTFGFFSRTIDAFLEALDIDDVGLVVHDLGGPVGLYWAVHHPERVRELSLLNTLCFPELSWAVMLFVASTHVPGVNAWLSGPGGVAFSMRYGVTNKDRITPEVEALYTAPYETDRRARKALRMSAQGLSPKRFKEIGEGLPKLADVPCRIIYGERDRILPDVAKTMARAAKILPRAEVTAIPDCGHFLQEDRPDEVATLLGEFFAPR